MVAETELAMSMIQLTGALLPFLAAITRYYLRTLKKGEYGLEHDPNNAVLFMGLLFFL